MKNLVIRVLSFLIWVPAILLFSLVPDAVFAPRRRTRGQWVLEVHTSGIWGDNPVLYRGMSNAPHLLAWVKAEVYAALLLASVPPDARVWMVASVRRATSQELHEGVSRVWSPYLPSSPKFTGELHTSR